MRRVTQRCRSKYSTFSVVLVLIHLHSFLTALPRPDSPLPRPDLVKTASPTSLLTILTKFVPFPHYLAHLVRLVRRPIIIQPKYTKCSY